MRSGFLALWIAAAFAVPSAAFGQSPFDMSGDQGAGGAPGAVTVAPAPPALAPGAVAEPPLDYPAPMSLGAPAPAPAPTAIPMMVPSIGGSDAVQRGAAPAVPMTAPAPVQAMPPPVVPPAAPVAAAEASQPAAAGHPRYIVPLPSLRFDGESDQRSWTIFATAGEAASPSTISVGYKNAIVVMPEASRLRILINGLVALETPLASADDFKVVTAELPANTLQPGSNLVRFEVVQRHRTDCTVQSTYELWTQVDPAATLIDFKGDAAAMTPATLEDLPAVGYDASGRTTIHILTSRTNEAAVLPLMLRLAQAIALYGQYPNPSVVVGERKGETDGPGTLTLLVAPTSDLAAMTDRPPAATGQPMVSFLPSAAGGPSVLAITGADWSQIQAAIDAVALRVDRPLDVPRTSMDTASWFAPNVHFFTGAEAVPFADLGVPTQQFSGRRLRVEFGVGIPSDFYAEAYGEATLLLDAAYTPAVLPASHIDVYVNGQIAATTRIVTKGGGIFRHFPINLPLRNFHPGVNRITLEAVLDTADDRVCGPGGSIAGPDRFALFDTSEFSLPSFARIGRRPDLAAFAGTGSPYNRQVAPSALVVPRTNSDTIAAASTLLARLAIQAGRIVPVTSTPMAGVGDRPAIFIGATGQMPPELLRRLGISDEIRTAWKPDAGIARRAGGAAADAASPQLPGADRESTDVLFDEWRNKLSDGGGWRGQVSGIEDWLKRTFDISFATLSLGGSDVTAFQPRPKASVMLAQGSSPGDTAAWTLLTAPSDEQLAEATRSLVAIETWSRVGGQFSTYNATTGAIDNVEPRRVTFIPTQPLSMQNMRLVAANWLSNHVTFYAIMLIGSCLLLGVITSGLMHRLGRPS